MSAARRQIPGVYGWDNNGLESDNHGHFGREQDIEMRNTGQSDVITEPPSADKPVIEGKPGTRKWYANIHRFNAEHLRQKKEKKKSERKPKTKKRLCWDVFVRILSIGFTVWDLYADWSFYVEPKSDECKSSEDAWLGLTILASVLACLQLLHFINDTVIDIRQIRSNSMDVKGIFGKFRLKKPFEILTLFLSKIPQGILPLVFHCFCSGEPDGVDTIKLLTKLAKSSAVTDFFSVFVRSLETDAGIWFNCNPCCRKPYYKIENSGCYRMVTIRKTGEVVFCQCCYICCLYEMIPNHGCYCSTCFVKCEDRCTCERDWCKRTAPTDWNWWETLVSWINRFLYLGSLAIVTLRVLVDLSSFTCSK
ncbi:uncharacterized protein LOC106162401 [Lingula anatina]|uniref:Uncharacterized protein LOC106162401 n=1 Tax=Lingula anatina TaxID=7574 RepID=A0A1S3ICJ4_LINAN|nr:uncharacterized protein LOC106162401 [Lingula anatina]|eukprot:XP_013395149.1 uncharacterized protein LOC106162401 [Lingula anatina]